MYRDLINKSRKNERGAVAVEMAFVLPLLMVLILGLTAFGMLLNVYVGLIHSAREGARYAALRQDSSAVSTRASVASPQLDSASMAVSMTIDGSPVSTITEADQGNPVRVTVSYPTPSLITELGAAVGNIAAIFGGGGLAFPASMEASATQMVE